MTLWTDYENGIDYEGNLVNLLEYGEKKRKKKAFLFLKKKGSRYVWDKSAERRLVSSENGRTTG